MTTPRIDALQYCQWSRAIFEDMRAGGLDAVHATVLYHGGFHDCVRALADWNTLFDEHADLIRPVRTPDDLAAAQAEGRIAVLLGSQNPMPIQDDLGLVAVLRHLGLTVMQLTYNQQSLLGTGCWEGTDGGLTAMGREVIAEMERVGMAIDLSHANEATTLDAIGAASRPIAVTHANPAGWHATPRNVSDTVIDALAESGGMLGLSLYPHHLAGGSGCTLAAFCEMAARTAERIGVERLGIGSDLCQGRPDAAVEWMRTGRWRRSRDEGAAFPAQPSWFESNRDWAGIASGLQGVGFDGSEVEAVMGGNWARHLSGALACPSVP